MVLKAGRYKTWTLNSGLDYGLHYGLDFELDIVGVINIVYWLVARNKLPQKCFRRLSHRNVREEEQQLLVDSLPDRIVHPEQYGSLHDPCTNVSRW